jgi:hypothetical protein
MILWWLHALLLQIMRKQCRTCASLCITNRALHVPPPPHPKKLFSRDKVWRPGSTVNCELSGDLQTFKCCVGHLYIYIHYTSALTGNLETDLTIHISITFHNNAFQRKKCPTCSPIISSWRNMFSLHVDVQLNTYDNFANYLHQPTQARKFHLWIQLYVSIVGVL